MDRESSTKFYHRTTQDAWKEIQREGVLWGVPEGGGYRHTYLSPASCLAHPSYGDVVLEVEYTPTGKAGIDNYGFDPPEGQVCWQFSVFIPIPICQCRRLSRLEVGILENAQLG